MSNATCFTKHAPFEGPPLIQNGQLKLQAHHVGWIITFVFTLVATGTSFWLIFKHLMWYTKKRQQRYIVRLLLMVPIYATVSLASYIFWNHAIPITLARDSYEALVLYSFFYLLLQYLSPTTDGQKEVFRNVVLKKWVFPLGFVKYRPEDGLYFLQLMKWGVLQYCVVRPTTTLAAVILDSVGLYCEDSWGPGWGHVYITVIVSVSVTIAMYCLIQLYIPISQQLASHKPMLKLISVKAVVFLTFWQATGLSFLTMFGVVKDTNYMTAEDINTGIAAILETFEMMCFAFLHIRAFSYKPYRDGSDGTPRFRSFLHALDFRDMWREMWDGSIYMGRTMRGIEAEEDVRKRIHFAKVMGRERGLNEAKQPKHVWAAETDGLEEELLLDGHGRGIGRGREDVRSSDPSNRFCVVERELLQTELDKEYHGRLDLEAADGLNQGHTRGQNSWWKGIYDRLSQGGPDHANEERLSPIPQRPSHAHRSRKHHRRGSRVPSLDSPPPPASVMYEYSSPGGGRSSVRLSLSHQRTSNAARETQAGGNAPLGHHYGKHLEASIAGLSRETRINGLSTQGQSLAHTRAIAAPQPMSASRVGDMEFLVSRDESPLPSAGRSCTPDHDSDRLTAPLGVLRSDSLLARVFPNSATNTADAHASSEGRTNPTSSHETLSSGLMFPPAMSSSSVDLTSPIRGRRAEPFSTPILSYPLGFRSSSNAPTPLSLSPPTSGARDPKPRTASSKPRKTPPKPSTAPPKHGRARPEIVLPAPLSPAHYPIESPRHGYSPPQNASHPSAQAEVPSQSLTQLPPFTQDSRDHAPVSPHRSDKRNNRRHSAQIERPLARHHRATKRTSVPAEDVAPRDVHFTSAPREEYRSPFNVSTDGDGKILHTGGTTFDPFRLSDSPIGNESAPRLMTSPSSPPFRTLRRARDDVGNGKRPRS